MAAINVETTKWHIHIKSHHLNLIRSRLSKTATTKQSLAMVTTMTTMAAARAITKDSEFFL